MQHKFIESDVLVIGGGMAGSFAAIKAREQGLDVTLVDKGYAGKSGSTPYAFHFQVFDPERGHRLDEWMNHVNTRGEYINNRMWTEISYKDSFARFQDLISWGVKFLKGADGEIVRRGPPITVVEAAILEERDFAHVLRKQAIKEGVRILDKIMVTELIKRDGRVVGAVGIPLDSYQLYVFGAKATVMSAGCASFKPVGWPVSELTADADAMAYRAGAEITGKEFNDTHDTDAEHPATTLGMLWGKVECPPAPWMNPLKGVNAEGTEIIGLPGALTLDIYFEAHAGRAPIHGKTPEGTMQRIVGGASAGMSIHTAEGTWPTNESCASSVPGLFAAGDSCGTMQVGAMYSGVGAGLAGAAVTGARAGLGAAKYALQAEKPSISEKEITGLNKAVHQPVKRKGGFSPRWVTQVLQNTMVPYFIMYVKHEARLKAALTIVEFTRDHLVPKLIARDPHELRLAHETRNMVLNAEMKLRASLFRKESRGTHYREDYPFRDDPTWLAWVILKQEQGDMKVFKRAVPKEWWPDLSKSYEKRYAARFPGEVVPSGRKT
jgi:succinate dehydrogenase/fumarate reductase flavoprotein subunit